MIINSLTNETLLNLTVNEGSSPCGFITCTIQGGQPLPSLSWRYNGNAILPSGVRQVSVNSAYMSNKQYMHSLAL